MECGLQFGCGIVVGMCQWFVVILGSGIIVVVCGEFVVGDAGTDLRNNVAAELFQSFLYKLPLSFLNCCVLRSMSTNLLPLLQFLFMLPPIFIIATIGTS